MLRFILALAKVCRPRITVNPAAFAKTDAIAKTDANKVPALCAQMQDCGCGAMTAKKAKSGAGIGGIPRTFRRIVFPCNPR
jgi:hypothetical protein